MKRLDQITAQLAALQGMTIDVPGRTRRDRQRCVNRPPLTVVIVRSLRCGADGADTAAGARSRHRRRRLSDRVRCNAITDVDGRARRAHDAHRRRPGAHRRHGDRAARRQRVSGQGGRRGVRRQRVRQARRLDAGRRARHDRNADRPDQHAERRHGDGRGRRATRSRSRATSRCDRSTRWSAKPTTAG